jgi:hypothetical protein
VGLSRQQIPTGACKLVTRAPGNSFNAEKLKGCTLRSWRRERRELAASLHYLHAGFGRLHFLEPTSLAATPYGASVYTRNQIVKTPQNT